MDHASVECWCGFGSWFNKEDSERKDQKEERRVVYVYLLSFVGLAGWPLKVSLQIKGSKIYDDLNVTLLVPKYMYISIFLDFMKTLFFF